MLYEVALGKAQRPDFHPEFFVEVWIFEKRRFLRIEKCCLSQYFSEWKCPSHRLQAETFFSSLRMKFNFVGKMKLLKITLFPPKKVSS
jgi:hypothetical protein